MRKFPGTEIPANEPQSWLRRALERLTDYAYGKYGVNVGDGSQRARIVLCSSPEHPDSVLQVQMAVYKNGTQGWQTVLAVDGGGNALFKGAVGGASLSWRPSTHYAVDDRASPLAYNGHWYKVTVAGVSAAAEPSWPTGSGATVVDGGVTWAETGAPPAVDMNSLGLETQG